MNQKLNVTVWSEGFARDPKGAKMYPNDVNTVIADFLAEEKAFQVQKGSLLEPQQGLSDQLIDNTDVLLWWGHLHHDEVEQAKISRICDRILRDGMGFIALHSGIYSKVMERLVGPTCGRNQYREIGERERIWLMDRSHPIVDGLGKDFIEVPRSEMYSEPSGRAAPDELIFVSWFQGGEVFRTGGTYRRGAGKIFAFATGHEEYPIYHQQDIQHVIRNAVFWARPIAPPPTVRGEAKPIENL